MTLRTWVACTSAPSRNRAVTTAACALWHARCRGVVPSGLETFKFAPAAASASTMCTNPFLLAR
jgi:hypothetical protein